MKQRPSSAAMTGYANLELASGTLQEKDFPFKCDWCQRMDSPPK